MPFSLPRLARQQGRRRNITLRPIFPTQMQANDLASIIDPAWQVWQAHRDRILRGYDPAPLQGDTLTVDSIADIAAAINAAAAEFLTRLVVEVQPALRRYGVRTELWHRRKWIAAVDAGTGVDLSTVLSGQATGETLGAWLERMTALVKDVSAQAQGRISDAVYRGYQARTPVREVAKEIDAAVGLGRKRSTLIASDQISKLSAALDRERQAEAGIEMVKWRHSGKVHPRSWHLARNGKIFELRSGKQVGGTEKIAPDDRAGMQPYCGCREQAYIALMDEI